MSLGLPAFLVGTPRAGNAPIRCLRWQLRVLPACPRPQAAPGGATRATCAGQRPASVSRTSWRLAGPQSHRPSVPRAGLRGRDRGAAGRFHVSWAVRRLPIAPRRGDGSSSCRRGAGPESRHSLPCVCVFGGGRGGLRARSARVPEPSMHDQCCLGDSTWATAAEAQASSTDRASSQRSGRLSSQCCASEGSMRFQQKETGATQNIGAGKLELLAFALREQCGRHARSCDTSSSFFNGAAVK